MPNNPKVTVTVHYPFPLAADAKPGELTIEELTRRYPNLKPLRRPAPPKPVDEPEQGNEGGKQAPNNP